MIAPPRVALASSPSNVSTCSYPEMPGSSLACGSSSSRAAEMAAGRNFASPKSSSLAPLAVSITLDGLRSRWTIDWECAWSSALAISIACVSACSSGAALRQPGRQRLAFEIFHDEEVDLVLTPDVIQRADVRMRKGGNGPRFAGETGAHARGCDAGRKHFDRDRPVETAVDGAEHLSHPARAEKALDAIGAQHHARGNTRTVLEQCGHSCPTGRSAPFPPHHGEAAPPPHGAASRHPSRPRTGGPHVRTVPGR